MSETTIDGAALRACGFALDDGGVAVPEHLVKGLLRELGVEVPRSIAVTDGATAGEGLADAAAGLAEPLVLKAWGPGLVHKSDAGAVKLDLTHDGVTGAAAEMDSSLRSLGFSPAGFLVEEQAQPGVELIVGVIDRDDFGPVVMLGVGGTLAELVDRTVLGLCPLDEAGAREMLDAFPARALLDGFRGAPPVDRDALIQLLVKVAGRGGLVQQLGADLAEFECNPVIATAKGAVAVDGRLILRTAPAGDAGSPLPAKATQSMDRLFAPKTIAVLGASPTRLAFGNRFLRAYTRAGWDEGLYAVHPEAKEIDGVPAVASIDEVPGPIDYLLVAVPAKACPDVVRAGAGKVAFAQVMTAGFREAGDDGTLLEASLLRAGREAGVRIVGPNCMGTYSSKGRQTFQARDSYEPGGVSVISQSGGLGGDLLKAGFQRGIRYSKLVTIGNAIDITPAELVDYFLDDDETTVIGGYLEGAMDGRNLIDALDRARGRKPVVFLVGGLSGTGARAAASHTGSMTGDTRVWEAVSRATGISVVTTLDDLVGSLAYLQRYWDTDVADDPAALVIGAGGGASIQAADAADRTGLLLEPVADHLEARLRGMGYGAGTSVANPIEVPVGPGVTADTLDPVLTTILAEQTYSDVLVHMNVHSHYSQGDRGVAGIIEMVEHLTSLELPCRLAFVLRTLEVATGDDLDSLKQAMRRFDAPYFRSFDEAMVAINVAKRFTATRVAVASGVH